jgi:protein phosphatase
LGDLDNLFIVADGMGGYQGGEYASQFVVRRTHEVLRRRLRRGEPKTVLEQTLVLVNKELYSVSQETDSLRGMGTTVVMATEKNGIWTVLNAGDSRLYHYDGVLNQITKDHSWVEEMVARGALSRDDPIYDARKNVITRAVGIAPFVEPDLFELKPAPGDRILMCSDGLSNMLDRETISRILYRKRDPEEAAARLVELANENGGKDNISVIVIETE